MSVTFIIAFVRQNPPPPPAEAIGRAALVEEQWEGCAVAGAGPPLALVWLMAAQQEAQASRAQQEAPEAALEEWDVAVRQLGRELEAQRDA